jgi:dienelactone hydrolase/tRNA A-37 threonylcarbamoyl transferase component Bud32
LADGSADGRVVSHYRITDRVDGGGMGVIYAAEDTHLKRTVALKFLAPELTTDTEARDRFMQEAEAASALDHPNICTIYDVDTATDGQLFIAMAYYDGETLKTRLTRGPLAVVDALGIAAQIARGLEKAHQSGIVHRDIKPANLMITRDGLVKILDFGVAKLRGRAGLTRTGVTLGTIAYMAPEQIRGGAADARADLWSLGTVLYEMLTGRSPFEAKSDLVIIHNILHETPEPAARLRPEIPAEVATTIDRLMAKDPDLRYQTASDVLEALTPHATGATTAVTTTNTQVVQLATSSFNRIIAATAAVALIAAAGTIAWFVKRGSDERRVNSLVAEATRLADADDDIAALTNLEGIERLAPKDPRLPRLETQIAIRRSIVTTPDGVDVYSKPYGKPAAPWQHLGRTPLRDVRVARGVFRWKLEKDGFEPIEVAGPAARLFAPLAPRGTVPPNMVLVRGGPLSLDLVGYNYSLQFPAGDYLIDKYEVTNKQFKAFVDAGGYAKREYWAERIVKDGRVLSWTEATENLRDRTGRPGPSTWEVGRYPTGQDDFPVSGVSWYEADAFARFSGRSLPSVYHWVAAAGISQAAYVTPLSNFAGKGPAAVGSFAGLSVAGAYDMAGNVREWCANAVVGTDDRYILGGSWADPEYVLTQADARAPFDRSAENGLRLVTYLDKALPQAFTDPIAVSRRDYLAERPVSDQVFNAYRALYEYDPRPLDARVEARDDSNPDWIRERVTFRAAYDDEREPAYVYLPKSKPPPYQVIVYMPGANSLQAGNSADLHDTSRFDYALVSGRAVIYPIYEGTYERNTGQTSTWPQKTRAYQEWMVKVLNDARRAVDYLQSRRDIRTDEIAYLGSSWGAAVGTRILALEPRFKTAILMDGGFPQESKVLPELDALNYAPRITLPVLMINGNSDFLFPLESGQKPYFQLLGTPPEHKRHVVLTGGHAIINQQRSQVVRVVLDWLDRYLGPVDR